MKYSQTVEAEPASFGEYCERVLKSVMPEGKERSPRDEGYMFSLGGYLAWCPAKEFESASHKVED